MSHRLARELSLLYAVEAAYKLPAAPIVRQLVEWEQRSLPDMIPLMPRWTTFDWPTSGVVDWTNYWRQVDRERGVRWVGEYL